MLTQAIKAKCKVWQDSRFYIIIFLYFIFFSVYDN